MKRLFVLITVLFLATQGVLFSGEKTGVVDQRKEQRYKAIVPTLFTPDEILMADTAAGVSYLTEEEKKVILYINLARLDGQRFVDDFADRYLTVTGLAPVDPYVVSLYEDLPRVRDLQMLQPLRPLCEAAAYHAEDLGRNGITGHTSSDGTSFGDRLRKFLPTAGLLSENCSCGTYDSIAIVIVMELLIDTGVPSFGHRKNMLNERATHIGVAIREHQSNYRYNCVQDFAGRLTVADHQSAVQSERRKP